MDLLEFGTTEGKFWNMPVMNAADKGTPGGGKAKAAKKDDAKGSDKDDAPAEGGLRMATVVPQGKAEELSEEKKQQNAEQTRSFVAAAAAANAYESPEKLADKWYSRRKPVFRELLSLYDMFDFQCNRFGSKEAKAIAKDDLPDFFEKMVDFVAKSYAKTPVDLSPVLISLNRTLCFSMKGNEAGTFALKQIFELLRNQIVDIAKIHGGQFMPLDESDETVVNIIEVEERQGITADKFVVIRRGLKYQDLEIPEYKKTVRMQEVKLLRPAKKW